MTPRHRDTTAPEAKPDGELRAERDELRRALAYGVSAPGQHWYHLTMPYLRRLAHLTPDGLDTDTEQPPADLGAALAEAERRGAERMRARALAALAHQDHDPAAAIRALSSAPEEAP